MYICHSLTFTLSLFQISISAPTQSSPLVSHRINPAEDSWLDKYRPQAFHSPEVSRNDLITYKPAGTEDRRELLDTQNWQHDFEGTAPPQSIKTIRPLGSGISAQVWGVIVDGAPFAMKAPWSDYNTKMIAKEYWIMHYYETHLSEEAKANLIRLEAGVWADKTSSQQRQLEFILMEYADKGTLEAFLREKRFLSEMQRIDFIIGFVSAIRNLHKIKISHGDIKFDNVLVRSLAHEQFVPKVADFGSAQLLVSEHSDPSHLFQDDIWQVGSVVQQIALGPDLWKNWNGRGLLQNQYIKGEDGRKLYLSDALLGIVFRMRQDKGENRLPGEMELRRLRALGSIYQDSPSSRSVAELVADES